MATKKNNIAEEKSFGRRVMKAGLE